MDSWIDLIVGCFLLVYLAMNVVSLTHIERNDVISQKAKVYLSLTIIFVPLVGVFVYYFYHLRAREVRVLRERTRRG